MTILYGTPAQPLEEVLDLFMVQQGNDRRSHYASYIITANEVWEQLFRDTIWDVRQILVDVDKVNNTIQLPAGMERLISISVVDRHNNLQPITYDPNINALHVKCHPKTCSCTTCNGEGTLCDAIDSITMRTEAVVINTVTYYDRIWNRKDGCSIVEVREAHVLDGEEVTTVENVTRICDLELDEKGCIKATEPNRDTIWKHCGCYISDCHRHICDRTRERTQIPADYSHYGFWKQDALCDGTVHLKHVSAEKVIVSYQPAAGGDNNGVMVPKYAKDAMMYGLHYYTVRFSRAMTRSEKGASKQEWEVAKRKLYMFMNPINLSEFTKLSSRRIYW